MASKTKITENRRAYRDAKLLKKRQKKVAKSIRKGSQTKVG